MAKKKIQGPYEVRPVHEYDEVVGWEVVGVLHLPKEIAPNGAYVVASDPYKVRQSAYRRCAELNRQSQHRQMISEV